MTLSQALEERNQADRALQAIEDAKFSLWVAGQEAAAALLSEPWAKALDAAIAAQAVLDNISLPINYVNAYRCSW